VTAKLVSLPQAEKETDLQSNQFHGHRAMRRKGLFFPVLAPTPPSPLLLQHRAPKRQCPRRSCEILTRFPFCRPRQQQTSSRFRTAFACRLGSSDRCSVAIHMEPFFASAFWIFAATTKICTHGCSKLAPQVSMSTAAAPLLVVTQVTGSFVPSRRAVTGPALQHHQFLGTIDSACELLCTP